mmetsp:Transcript_5267/g.15954  ORF Transcript_5267/g.15954 Transcript_5267/m.15954 type:complete len:204 (+) Transcript_5267:2770-3381(+)
MRLPRLPWSQQIQPAATGSSVADDGQGVERPQEYNTSQQSCTRCQQAMIMRHACAHRMHMCTFVRCTTHIRWARCNCAARHPDRLSYACSSAVRVHVCVRVGGRGRPSGPSGSGPARGPPRNACTCRRAARRAPTSARASTRPKCVARLAHHMRSPLPRTGRHHCLARLAYLTRPPLPSPCLPRCCRRRRSWQKQSRPHALVA